MLNANAKSVTKPRLKKLSSLIPKKDLFVSKNLKEAQKNLDKALSKNYPYIFCGGGDGTIMHAISYMREFHKKNPHTVLPKLGMLSLGTGNALARFLGTDAPEIDINKFYQGSSLNEVEVPLIDAGPNQLTPFAGVGYDGELMNDFESVKDLVFESPFRKSFSSVLGFFIAGAFKTLPRQVGRELPMVRINSSFPAYRIKEVNGQDEEIPIDAGEILYDGAAPLICVGSIPWVGYGLTLFPFANKKPGFIQLRISAVPLSICLLNLYPNIWHGHFRHNKLFDFLVKDVMIESDESLPYQVGGDAMGYKKKLYFKVASEPTSMISFK